MTPEILDAVIVGAGFGGVYQLKHLRDAGHRVKLLESGSNYGGVWYWNRYPGARVDSPIPHYEFSDPELWENWTWTERFPGSAEIRRYFAHVAEKWMLQENTVFGVLSRRLCGGMMKRYGSSLPKMGWSTKPDFFCSTQDLLQRDTSQIGRVLTNSKVRSALHF